MYGKRDHKSKEELEDHSHNVFCRITKTALLQEARAFNETPVNHKKCALILTKLLYLLNHGNHGSGHGQGGHGQETLSPQEATDAFFNLTKLFQSKDITLRRLVYLGIKDLSKSAENVYVVTSCLTQDMNSQDMNSCRPAAMRALITITDQTTFQGIERYMKQAIVDRNHALSSAALVSCLHLSRNLQEGIKRWSVSWTNEAQEAVNSENPMVQQHALGLLYHMRRSDRLAVTKMVSRYIRSGLKSPLAICFLIRAASKLVEEEGTTGTGGENGTQGPYYEFLSSCLRHKSEMVIYEAANAIVNLSCTSQRELTLAISVLQLFLSSSKPTLRFAAVRTLNKVAGEHPSAVMSCNVDLENLITDSNRSIATLAITTLLKTGAESGVERLLKQIGTFMGEISDEFKIVVVSATRQLCSKFPKKHNVLMTFLSGMLREDGGYEYKKSIVETIINIIGDDPDAKEAGLNHLCEFIEDCEHVNLAVRILHLLGREGPRTPRPSRYIRYIYNRLILETSQIRAAAVSSLAKFGAHCEDLLPNIIVLLERSALDSDNEVRDRSVYYLSVLKTKQKVLYANCILSPLQVSLVSLEKSLEKYLENESQYPFDMHSVPMSAVPTIEEVAGQKKMTNGISTKKEVERKNKENEGKTSLGSIQDQYAAQLSRIPELEAHSLGPLLKSAVPVDLTETETEYFVQVIKHMYRNHILLQFDVTNTCSDQVLENVSVNFQVIFKLLFLL